jgi:hypothetical protein
MKIINNRNIWIGVFIIFLFSCIFISEAFCDPINTQSTINKPLPGFLYANNNNLIKEILSRLDIILGFILGIFSACFVDYLRKRQIFKEYRLGIRAELKQTLGSMCILAINSDATISKEKVDSWITLAKEFDLAEELFPFRDKSQSFKKIEINEKTLNEFIIYHQSIKCQRDKDGAMQIVKIINCTFINDNISMISLLKKQQCSSMFNLLRYIDLINTEASRLNFFFEKSYDDSIRDVNRDRLRLNYLNSCQCISDWSHIAAKEIASLLREM